MPSIAELNIYPIKSCAGIRLNTAVLTDTGLSAGGVYDREWMLVDQQGLFLTQREYPLMATIRPELGNGHLLVHAANMTALQLPLQLPTEQSGDAPVQVTIWEESFLALDAGDEAAAWFSQVLGIACRLVRSSVHTQRFANQKWTGNKHVPTRFSDGYPILLTGTASLDDLNERLQQQGRDALPMNRFRPNVVLDEMEAYEEDYAECFEIGADIQLRPVKPCPRCPMPSIDQLTGKIGPDPLDILQTYRANPLVDGGITFGMNIILDSGTGHTLRLGDEVNMQIAF
ncbi:MOSC domain-containing protein [Undibacterium sp. Ji49W]|uniref:MOSC domain-containing protein n=1 Tax=Undibacterium sp. Ji49W TaxID=3413040 RepID=UPI003BF30F60